MRKSHDEVRVTAGDLLDGLVAVDVRGSVS